MYAFQSLTRIYSFILLCLCAAVLFVPSLANASNQLSGYWSMAESRWISEQEMEQRVQRELKRNIYKPSNSTLSTAPSAPTFSKNAGGGLSQTSQSIIRNMGHPSTFSTSANYSLQAARNALGSCVRSPACVGRALGTGAIIYQGVQGWKEVYGFVSENDDGELGLYKRIENPPIQDDTPYPCTSSTVCFVKSGFETSNLMAACLNSGYNSGENSVVGTRVVSSGSKYQCQFHGGGSSTYYDGINRYYTIVRSGSALTGGLVAAPPSYEPVSNAELDDALGNYDPEPSDAPLVLLSGEPQSLTLSTPESVQLPATTTTSTNSLGETETTVTNQTINYNVTNNNTSNPSINSTTVENTTVYNDYGTVINTSTKTTTSEGVQGDTSSPLEFELPAFCTWAEFLCDWLNWTKEPLDEEEPDLAILISEFEPDEDGYSSGIGSGSCPAPMSLNLGIISQTVEVSYQPFCDFLAMIRPLVIAGAWLISAFMYVGVLRRG